MSKYCDEAKLRKKYIDHCSDQALENRNSHSIEYKNACAQTSSSKCSENSADDVKRKRNENEQLLSQRSRTKSPKIKKCDRFYCSEVSDFEKPTSSKLIERNIESPKSCDKNKTTNGNHKNVDETNGKSAMSRQKSINKKICHCDEADFDNVEDDDDEYVEDDYDKGSQDDDDTECNEDDADEECNEDLCNKSAHYAPESINKLCTCDEDRQKKKSNKGQSPDSESDDYEDEFLYTSTAFSYTGCEERHNRKRRKSSSRAIRHSKRYEQEKAASVHKNISHSKDKDYKRAASNHKHKKQPIENKKVKKSFWSFLNCFGCKSHTQSIDSIRIEADEVPVEPLMRPCGCHRGNSEICPYCQRYKKNCRKSCIELNDANAKKVKEPPPKRKKANRRGPNQIGWEMPTTKYIYYGKPMHYSGYSYRGPCC